MALPLSKNVTVPAGVSGEDTVAVIVTVVNFAILPEIEIATVDVSVVVELFVTACEERLAASFPARSSRRNSRSS